MISAARKGIILQSVTTQFQPLEQAGASVVHQLELNRPPCLLLNNDRSRPNFPITRDVAGIDLHQITTSQFAVDGEVEKRPVKGPSVLIKEEADYPNLAGLQMRASRQLCDPNSTTFVRVRRDRMLIIP
jgi:hypothetical protein